MVWIGSPGSKLALACALSCVGLLVACHADVPATAGADTDPMDSPPDDPDPTVADDDDDDDAADTGDDDDDAAGGGSGGGEVDPRDPGLVPPPGGMRRLLAHQYVASVEMMLGKAAGAAAAPAADASLGAFPSLAAVELSVPPVAIEDYESSALAIGTATVGQPGTLASRAPCVADEAPISECYGEVVDALGRLAWRRPLTEDERSGLVALAEQAQAWGEGSFETGLEYLILGLLQSPHFVYVVEVGELDEATGTRRLDSHELATRLSLFLLGRTPDDALLDVAARDGLESEDALRELAWAMLDDPAAPLQVRRFFTDLLAIGDLEDAGKNQDLFPLWSEALASAMREETLRLVDDVVFDEPRDILTLLDATFTYVDANLAEVYGVTPPRSGWARIDNPPGRAGIMTQPSFLATHSHPSMNSPTRRGLFVQEVLLCNKIPPPPPEVNPKVPPPSDEAQTLKELLEQHMEDPACAPCHAVVDPIGFAFEGFDVIGVARTHDNGEPVETNGAVANIGEWGDAVELAALLQDDPRVASCLLKNVYRHALGYVETEEQLHHFDQLDEAFEAVERDFAAVLVELAASDLFRRVGAPK